MEEEMKQEIQEAISSETVQAEPEQTPADTAATPVMPIPDAVMQANVPAVDLDAVKTSAARDIFNVRKLINAGLVAPAQAQGLVQQIIQKAYDAANPGSAAAEYDEEFFRCEGRCDVLDYLKKSNLGKDEIGHVTALINKVEQAAVANYLKKQERDKALNSQNEAAKRRMRVSAQKPGAGINMAFTREQIGKMSCAEFAKHERSIMEQLRKGLIR